METLKAAEKPIEINKLNEKQADTLSLQIGEKVREMVDSAANDINKLLNQFGMSAKFQVIIQAMEASPKATDTPKKRRSPRKQS